MAPCGDAIAHDGTCAAMLQAKNRYSGRDAAVRMEFPASSDRAVRIPACVPVPSI
jgi:hypothetical protein